MRKSILNAAILAALAGQARREQPKTNPMLIAMRNAAEFARKISDVRNKSEGIGGA